MAKAKKSKATAVASEVTTVEATPVEETTVVTAPEQTTLNDIVTDSDGNSIDAVTGEIIDTRITEAVATAVSDKPKFVNITGHLFQVRDNPNFPNSHQYHVMVNGNKIGNANRFKYNQSGIDSNFTAVMMYIGDVKKTFTSDYPITRDNGGKTGFEKANAYLKGLARELFKNPEYEIQPDPVEAA